MPHRPVLRITQPRGWLLRACAGASGIRDYVCVGEDRTERPGLTTRRATVSEAADIIGISAEAVRMRIRRGTLPSERHEGTVYVILDTDRTQRVGDMSGNVSGDRTDELLEAL